MKTEIISRVAEFIRNPDSRKNSGKVSAHSAMQVRDKIEISTNGQEKLKELEKAESHWEKARLERVSRIQEQVNASSYSLSPQMVDDIAEKIVQIL
jgi:hypothetical protein